MGLTEQEKRTLEALNKKAKEPDPAPVGKSVNITIDPKDKASVDFAIQHGFLTAPEVEEPPEGDDGDGEEGEETPKRRGYFGDN